MHAKIIIYYLIYYYIYYYSFSGDIPFDERGYSN